MKKRNISFDSKALVKQLEKMAENNAKATTRAGMDVMLDLSAESAESASIESADLRNNCHAVIQDEVIFVNQAPQQKKIKPSAYVAGFVGYSLPYAWKQHEELSFRHDRTDGYRRLETVRYKTTNRGEVVKYISGSTVNLVAGGDSKFLEGPAARNKKRYEKHVIKEVKKGLGIG